MAAGPQRLFRLVLVGICAAVASPASAKPWIAIGGEASIPYGHHQFCKTYRNQCGQHAVREPVALTRSLMSSLRSVNLSVNRAVKSMSDREIHGRLDVWSISVKAGDCEDYALMKRRALMSRGLHPSQLLIAMVRRNNGEAHVVLTVRTDQGDLVLDNLRDSVLPWNRTGYQFLKVQSPGNGAVWLNVAGSTDLLTN